MFFDKCWTALFELCFRTGHISAFFPPSLPSGKSFSLQLVLQYSNYPVSVIYPRLHNLELCSMTVASFHDQDSSRLPFCLSSSFRLLFPLSYSNSLPVHHYSHVFRLQLFLFRFKLPVLCARRPHYFYPIYPEINPEFDLLLYSYRASNFIANFSP